MEISQVYAITLGGILFTLLLIGRLPMVPYSTFFTPPLVQQALRYLKYPYIVHRHRFLGPWTCADVFLQVVYIAGNSFCLGFRVSDISKAGGRAGTLSLINMIPLFLGPHLGFLADLLGISLSTFRLMHRSAGAMSCSLVLFHIIAMFVSLTSFSLDGIANISATVSGASLGLIIVMSWSWSPLRKWAYEFFLRLHQLLAAIAAISALLHMPSMLFPRLYFYISLGIFIATSTAEGVLLLYHNGIIARAKNRRLPRVREVFKYPGKSDNRPIQLSIIPQEPLRMEAGQYINIYIPSVGVRSSVFLQTHPFVVTSWTGKTQTKLELVIERRRGWTKLLQSIIASEQSGGLNRVLFTGPHGAIIPVSNYEYVFMVASGYGIVAQLPLLERLVQGTLAREVRARRIHLVWDIEDIGLYEAVYPRFNWVLVEDRKLGKNPALTISIYSAQMAPAELSKRAKILPGPLPLSEVFEAEIAEIEKRKMQETEAVRKMEAKRAEQIEKGRKEVFMGRSSGEISYESGALPVCTSTPRMLITVSASQKIRDELRSILWNSLKKDITLNELDYQPSD
ncbi:hypothetical protein BKA65DRAFT_571993 [Rhexocercosporidium sp. MPI-PUGE-AT-0058]|nr:hypothetical protein BKA65DRAFT_571993 [Rhexocercosporidium sp. MPI-PUGE-AT-0058]